MGGDHCAANRIPRGLADDDGRSWRGCCSFGELVRALVRAFRSNPLFPRSFCFLVLLARGVAVGVLDAAETTLTSAEVG